MQKKDGLLKTIGRITRVNFLSVVNIFLALCTGTFHFALSILQTIYDYITSIFLATIFLFEGLMITGFIGMIMQEGFNIILLMQFIFLLAAAPLSFYLLMCLIRGIFILAFKVSEITVARTSSFLTKIMIQICSIQYGDEAKIRTKETKTFFFSSILFQLEKTLFWLIGMICSYIGIVIFGAGAVIAVINKDKTVSYIKTAWSFYADSAQLSQTGAEKIIDVILLLMIIIYFFYLVFSLLYIFQKKMSWFGIQLLSLVYIKETDTEVDIQDLKRNFLWENAEFINTIEKYIFDNKYAPYISIYLEEYNSQTEKIKQLFSAEETGRDYNPSEIQILYENIKRLQKQILKFIEDLKKKAETKKEVENSYQSTYFKNCKNKSDLKKQYHLLCRMYHPDNGGDAEKFAEIQAEYERVVNEMQG